MAKTVFILGAGASVDAGVPVMENFLDEAERLYRNPEYSTELSKFKDVFDAISNMQIIHSKADFDLKNIEAVFAAIEFAKLLGRDFESGIEPESLSSSIAFLIYKTIELKTDFILENLEFRLNPIYETFNKLLVDYIVDNGEGSLAILTFNYDLAIDFAITMGKNSCDYGLPTARVHPSIPLLKLHGSINWGRCNQCGNIYPFRIEDYLPPSFPGNYINKTIRYKINTGTSISQRKCPSCKINLEDQPFIVPPTWNKTQYHDQIAHVWKKASTHLQEAENIFIIGYSLPEADYFFRYLYAIGTMGKILLKHIWVCNPDSEVDKRFRHILGSQAIQRYKFIQEKFHITVPTIRNVLLP